MAGIRDFYQARMDAEIPPIREEVQRIASQLGRMQDSAKEGQKRGILAKYVEKGRPRVPFGKYEGMDLLDLACVRSLLNSQMRQPMGLEPPHAGGVATEPEGCHGQHHRWVGG